VPFPRLVLLAAFSLCAVALMPLWAPTPAALAAAPALPAGCAQSDVGGTVTCTFDYSANTQTFTVPTGVTSVGLIAWGGHGWGGPVVSLPGDLTPGGRGALVSGTFPVQPSDRLSVVVGGTSTDENELGGFGYGRGGDGVSVSGGGDGGGGGGGGTLLADGKTLLLVAGGGGGGALSQACPAGSGGDAGRDGGSGDLCGSSSPGAGGVSGSGSTTHGGNGGGADPSGGVPGGGGGGGGYRGGDGGMAGQTSGCRVSGAGGGGGGSSYADSSGTSVDLTGLSSRGARAQGLAQLTYQPGPLAQISLSPAVAPGSVGTGRVFTVTAYDAGGASVADVTADAILSITPDGTCAGSTCTPSAPGPHTVQATYGALTAIASLHATAPPSFTSSDHAVFVPGIAQDVAVTATGAPTPALSVTGGSIPDGLSFIDHGDGTATLGGKATSAGRADVSITASSTAGKATQLLHVVVGAPPAFTSSRHASLVRNQEGNFSVVVAGSPAPGIARAAGTGVPRGLLLTDNGDGTATLAGAATGRPGRSVLSLTATNQLGTASQRLLVTITPQLGACANEFEGHGGVDRILGTPAGDRIVGRAGDDRLLGLARVDCLLGGPGDDVLLGGSGDDRLTGSSGSDHLVGGSGHDLLRAGAGDDLIRSHDNGRDVVWCGAGSDRVIADPMDRLVGCETVSYRSPVR
jgi:hypothetical protein